MISVPCLDNPKRHFILNDALGNVSYDLNFSILKKYICKAGCNLCYIKQDWIPDSSLAKYIPINVQNKSYIDRIMEFFSYFDLISTFDDMMFLKQEHPDFFRFYQEYGEVFYLSSFTDNAIGRQVGIIEKDINFKGFREISLSDTFLCQVNIKKLFNNLDRMLRRAPIIQIKAILSSDSELLTERANELIKWCKENNVVLKKQLIFEEGAVLNKERYNERLLTLSDIREDESTEYQESTAYAEEFGEIYPIQSEILFLMFDQFYSELKSATMETRSESFAHLNDFDPVTFLAKVLKSKVTDYARYTSSIKNKENEYFKYFEFVSKHLIVHEDYNFIPIPLLKPYSAYSKKLVRDGLMQEVKYGLVKPNTTTIKPIIEFKENEPNHI